MFIDMKAYSPANRTGSPQGFYKTCTLHKHKTYKQNPKVSPLNIAMRGGEKGGGREVEKRTNERKMYSIRPKPLLKGGRTITVL